MIGGGVNIRSREIITAAAEVISYLLVWSVQYFAKSPPCWLFTPSSDNVKRVNLKQKRCRKKLIGSTKCSLNKKGHHSSQNVSGADLDQASVAIYMNIILSI